MSHINNELFVGRLVEEFETVLEDGKYDECMSIIREFELHGYIQEASIAKENMAQYPVTHFMQISPYQFA